jgi:VanZ family protein
MWPLTLIVFLVLGTLAFRGARWAYITFVFLGLLFFPARVGFHLDPQPCEWELSLPLALFSLTKYAHIVLFAIFFLLTTVQARRYSRRTQLLIAACAVLAMGVYVEMAQALTGKGHCRLRDLIPDAAGALLGALLVVSWHTIRRPGLDPMP